MVSLKVSSRVNGSNQSCSDVLLGRKRVSRLRATYSLVGKGTENGVSTVTSAMAKGRELTETTPIIIIITGPRHRVRH